MCASIWHPTSVVKALLGLLEHVVRGLAYRADSNFRLADNLREIAGGGNVMKSTRSQLPKCRQHTQDTLCEFAVSLCMSLRASFFTNAPRSLK
jgi:hypothetical protein